MLAVRKVGTTAPAIGIEGLVSKDIVPAFGAGVLITEAIVLVIGAMD